MTIAPDRKLAAAPEGRREAATPAPRPAPAPAMIAADRVLVSTRPASKPKPAAEAPKQGEPEGRQGILKVFWDLMFGNTENKWFQIKVNLIHFKDVFLGLVQALQAGPLSPLFTLIDKVGGLFSGVMARLRGSAEVLAARPDGMGKIAYWLGRCARPLRAAGAVTLKWLERTAPLFGWLVAVQDLASAAKKQGDGKASADKKVLAWATFAFSAIGATASTIAAWSAVGAAVAVPTGLGAVGLGTIAILCFGASLLTGWLANRAPSGGVSG